MWKKIRALIIELVFPAECFFCKKPETFLCGDCAALLDLSQNHYRDRTHKYLNDVCAAGSYDNPYLKKLIVAFKYEPFLRSLAVPLAKLITNHFALAQIQPDRNAILIPVPLAQKRRLWRGYNQATALAQELSRIWQIPVNDNTLVRIRETQNQAGLQSGLRHKNIKNAFACPNPSTIKNKTVYLIDDVVTTGATMDECAKVLKRYGATIVIGLAIARAEN